MELPARTLSKPQQAVPLWPLSPSGAIRQPARDFQQGASFSPDERRNAGDRQVMQNGLAPSGDPGCGLSALS